MTAKVGDQLVRIQHDYTGSTCAIVTVERATATMLTVDGARYRRETGRIVGGKGWQAPRLETLTDTAREAVERAQARKLAFEVHAQLGARVRPLRKPFTAETIAALHKLRSALSDEEKTLP